MIKSLLIVLLLYFNKINGGNGCDSQDLCFPHNYCQENCPAVDAVVCENNKTKYVSCSHQLGEGYDTNDCLMEIPNYEIMKCSDRVIKPIDNDYKFGDINLKAYTYGSSKKTMIGVTFSNISWTDLTYRFYVRNHECNFRTVNIKTVSKISSLNFNCPWSSTGTEAKQGFFELNYGIEGSHTTKNFTFIIPKHEELDPVLPRNLDKIYISLFAYVDISESNRAVLYIEIPSKQILSKLNITDYDVYLNKKSINDDNRIYVKRFSNNDAVNGIYQLTVSMDTVMDVEYYFEIIPYNSNDYSIDYMETRTPIIKLPSMKYPSPWLMSFVIVAFVFLVMIIYLCETSVKQINLENEMYKRPEILFVYSPSHNSHINVIKKFTDILKESYNMDIMLDCIDLPKKRDKDPSNWLSESFHYARYVVYFISPDKETPFKDHPYRKLFELAINLTKQELSKDYSKKEYLVVVLPYSSDRIPPIVKNFKKYKFFKDFDKFLDVLSNKTIWERCFGFQTRRYDSKNIKKIVDYATVEINSSDINTTSVNMNNFKYITEESSLVDTENHDHESSDDKNISEKSGSYTEAINMDEVLSGLTRNDSDEEILQKTDVNFDNLVL